MRVLHCCRSSDPSASLGKKWRKLSNLNIFHKLLKFSYKHFDLRVFSMSFREKCERSMKIMTKDNVREIRVNNIL